MFEQWLANQATLNGPVCHKPYLGRDKKRQEAPHRVHDCVAMKNAGACRQKCDRRSTASKYSRNFTKWSRDSSATEQNSVLLLKLRVQLVRYLQQLTTV